MKKIFTLICSILFFSVSIFASNTPKTVVRSISTKPSIALTGGGIEISTTARPRSVLSEIFLASYSLEPVEIIVEFASNIGFAHVEVTDSKGNVVETKSIDTSKATDVSIALPQQNGEYLLKITTVYCIGKGILVIDDPEL